MKPEIQRAIASAVDLVNTHSGQACVRLRFLDDPEELELVANSASLRGNTFEFVAGFETYGGSVEELRSVQAELINH